MPTMATTIMTSASHGVTSHTISLRGLAGAIFFCLVVATLFAIVAFTTEGWAQVNTDKGGVKIGLWMTCLCQPNLVDFTNTSWFRSTQAMITMGLMSMSAATVAILIYMFIHTFNKNRVIKTVMILSSCALLFLGIGLSVFGVFTFRHNAMQGFSYVFGLIAGILCFTACILSCIQMTKSRTISCCACCKCCGEG